MKAKYSSQMRRGILYSVLSILVLLLLVTAMSACQGNTESQTDTATDAASDLATKAGTDGETAPVTDAVTDAQTETPTEPDTETEPVTDSEDTDLPETEPETTPPETEPLSNKTVRFTEDFAVDDLLSGSGYELSVVEEGDEHILSVRRLNDKASKITVKFDVIVESYGFTTPDSSDIQYIAFEMRKGSPDSAEWEPVFLPITDNTLKPNRNGTVKYLYIPSFSSMPKDDETWYLRSVSVTSSVDEAMRKVGMNEYVLGYGSTLDLTAYDPVNHVKITAPDEDDSVFLWFDHVTEKVNCDTVPVKDTVGYTIQMAKNEYEGCQFFLSAQTDRRFTVEYTPFTNDAGNSLYTELRVEFYPTEGAGLTVPDCLIPYENYVGFRAPEDCEWSYDVYGCVSVPANTTRGFVMQAKTLADTAPGLYSSDLRIIDAETQKCVKVAKVYTYVYNVTLSEETAMKTHVLCWGSMWMIPYEEWGYVHSDADRLGVLRTLADFLLDYRVCTQMNWGEEWLNNPRVTSVGVADGSEYEAYVSKNPAWNKKFLLYKVDEPSDKQRLDELKTNSTQFRSKWQNIRIVCPFETDIRLTNGDQIQFMSDYVNVWCPKFYCYTPRELSFIKGVRYTQSASQDEKYGTFENRMREFRESGDESWIYVSCLPDASAPYLNVLLGNDGTAPETIFWMCYRYDLTGFLYWNLFYWQSGGYGNGYLRYPVTKTGPGDGILLYPGCAYGTDEPMPSLRLVGIRDGIEDYQLLTMLEQSAGKDLTDDLVSHIATSVVTFNTDDDVLHNARVFMLRALENAGN